MKRLIPYIIFSFTCVAFTTPNPYQSFFKSNYDKAFEIFKKYNFHFSTISKNANISEKLLKSIVFPEVIRYNSFRNFLEQTALEFAYIDGGTEAIDFSIGYFQMKPSFIEKLEKKIKLSSSLKTKYQKLITFKEKDIKSIRRERLTRLEDIDYQILYSCAFVDCMEKKFKSYDLANKEKATYFSSAYNLGMDKSIVRIKDWSSIKAFPYGADYEGKQFSYSEISLHYYELID